MLSQEIANSHRAMGNVPAAEQWYRKAVDVNPALVESQIMLGVLARDRSDQATAGRHFREAARHNPEYSVPWMLLGEQQAAVGDTADATTSLRLALKAAPNNREAAALLARLSPKL
jgi:lipopolysaccharide biosynthesis regulator YciM